jgi:hypothetical protein
VLVASIENVRDLARRDQGLAVVVSQRADGSAQTSVVNAGVLAHPVSGDAVVGVVVRGGTRKQANLRRRPRATVVFRAGWEWVAVEGPVDLAGPDDPLDGLDAAGSRRCCATCSAPPAAPMTTGTSTTA